MIKKVINTFYLGLVCLPLAINAQSNYPFKHMNINHGLSNNQINCIFRDSQGFMWFGTGSGLNRYDGTRFKVFMHSDADPSSIISNAILEIQEDAQHNLWINTGSGFTIFNREKESFINPMAKYLQTLNFTDSVTFVFIDQQKNIWVRTQNQDCYLLFSESKKWLLIPEFSDSPVTDIFRIDHFVYGILTNGLVKILTLENQKPVLYKTIPNPESETLINTFNIFVDHDYDIWLFEETNPEGVYYYSEKKQYWQHITTLTENFISLTSNTVKDITEDDQHQIWIATDHGGINVVNKTLQTLTCLESNPLNPRSLADKSIMCLYFDHENILWAGTYKYGISYFSESIYKFNHVRFTLSGNENEFDNDINNFEEDLQGNLWIGSNNKGLLRIDNISGKQTLYQHKPSDPNSISNNVVVSLFCDHSGTLWIGTYQGGLNEFRNGKFIHYRHQAQNPNSISSDLVWDIIQDNHGNLWIATLGSGIDCFDPKTGIFNHYSTSTHPDLISDYIMSLQLSKDKKILIGTAHGLSVFDFNQKNFTTIPGNYSGTQSLVNRNVVSLFEDSRGLIWIGTLGGLHILNPKTDELTLLNKNSGLPDNVICSIQEDDQKNIWISTTNGLSHIILSVNPKDGKYNYLPSNYDERDGLQGKAFNERSAYKTSKGELLFGGTNGYNTVIPSSIKYNRNRPNLVFTDLFLFNKPVYIDSLYPKNKILEKSLTKTKKIALRYNQNIFTIEFSALNFLLPEKTIYNYKMDGFDQSWTNLSDNRHSATYTNLNPGSYTFRVKAANNDGYWSEQPIEMELYIRPPFWRSTWAYLFYYIFVTGLLIVIGNIIRNRVKTNFRLTQERLETKRNRELDEMKLRFFTNISHEFRTQISLIIIPLGKLIKSTNDEEQKKSLKLIQRNANKLLQLVNQLLDFRKLEMHGHKLNLSTGDVVQFIRETCLSFAEMYENKNMHLTFSSVTEEIRLNFDEDKLSKIINNLLSNAYKFTPVGGTIDVRLEIVNENNNHQWLKVSVADNGKGVSEEDKARIFERFYQVNITDANAGSGIGLHMSKEYVRLHGGDIWLEQNHPQGSIFIFTIPMVNSQLTEFERHSQIETLSTHEPSAERIVKNQTDPPHKSILIVEDNEDFRNFLSSSLIEHFDVLEASNGAEAFEVIVETLPDLIISDVMMPEMDGYQLCQKIKNDMRSSHIPVILLTAHTAKEQIVQ